MKSDIEHEYRQLRSVLHMFVFFVGPVLLLLTSLPLFIRDFSAFSQIFFWLYLGTYLIELLSLKSIFNSGGFFPFFVCLASGAAGLGVAGAAGFFCLLGIESVDIIAKAILSWLLLFPVMWWWGSRIYLAQGEIKEAVLRSKRIDLENATYSPYVIPHNLYESNWARKWLAMDLASGAVAASVAAYISYFVGAHSVVDAENFIGGISGYVLVIVSFWVISVGYHEARWMRNWEKKTGRKIYVKEIIEYKRLQARKQAQQN